MLILHMFILKCQGENLNKINLFVNFMNYLQPCLVNANLHR